MVRGLILGHMRVGLYLLEISVDAWKTLAISGSRLIIRSYFAASFAFLLSI